MNWLEEQENKTMTTTTKRWIDAGDGTLTHPISGRQVMTRVIELQGCGRIADVYHYGDEPELDFALMLAAPELLAALEKTAAVLCDLFEDLKSYGDQSRRDQVTSICNSASAAIARATGKATR